MKYGLFYFTPRDEQNKHSHAGELYLLTIWWLTLWQLAKLNSHHSPIVMIEWKVYRWLYDLQNFVWGGGGEMGKPSQALYLFLMTLAGAYIEGWQGEIFSCACDAVW